MSMGRPRNRGNNKYPEGFYPSDSSHKCRMKHPITGKVQSLKTNDINEGLDLYWQIIEHFKDRAGKANINQFTQYPGPLLPQISEEYRKTYLPNELSKRGASKGVKLDPQTRKTYANYLLNLEAEPSLQVPVGLFGDPVEGPKRLRQYLANWLTNPKTYNYRLTCYSRLFEHTIDLGHIQRNPCKDISNRTTPERDVYIPDDHYVLIAKTLCNEFHEVYARVCDWLYLMSGRTGNMLDIREKNITGGKVRYYATKNKRLGEMQIDPDIQFLIDWFRQYKRDQGIVSPHLIVHPIYIIRGGKKIKVRKQIAAQPITVDHIYRRFQKAKAKAGLSQYDYTPKDLRPKSLTDEAEQRGEVSNKGMHSEQMQHKYVKRAVPERLDNTLKLIPWDK